MFEVASLGIPHLDRVMPDAGGVVLFDLFETLFTEMHLDGPPRWANLSGELGIKKDDFRREWSSLFAQRMTTTLTYSEALSKVCRSLGAPPPQDTIAELVQLRRAHRQQRLAAPDPEVMAMLQAVRDLGWRAVVVSNLSSDEIDFLSSPLADLVDATVWSYELGVAKPHRHIYESACNTVGMSIGQAVFVGDGSFDELAGAQRAGATALWARWFVDQWPSAQREPRLSMLTEGPFPALERPGDLAHHIQQMSKSSA